MPDASPQTRLDASSETRPDASREARSERLETRLPALYPGGVVDSAPLMRPPEVTAFHAAENGP